MYLEGIVWLIFKQEMNAKAMRMMTIGIILCDLSVALGGYNSDLYTLAKDDFMFSICELDKMTYTKKRNLEKSNNVC